MIYQKLYQLKASQPVIHHVVNVSTPSRHYIHVVSGTVVIEGTLDESLEMIQLGSVTGPVISEIPTPVVSLKLTSDSDTSVAVCGA